MAGAKIPFGSGQICRMSGAVIRRRNVAECYAALFQPCATVMAVPSQVMT